MRIAQYYPWIYLRGGCERVIMEICRRSRHQHTVFTNHFDENNTYPELKLFDIVELSRVPVEREIGSVLKAAARIAFQKMDTAHYDVLLVHCDGLGDLVLSQRNKIPKLCFCHTPLRPVFDDYYRQRVLRDYRGIKRYIYNLFSAGFKVVDRRMWSHYNYVFFNSSETVKRAERGGLIRHKEGQYEVLHPGIDWNAHKPTWRFEPYFLVPGRIMWTKNIETAIRAFILFKNHQNAPKNFRLLIAGSLDAKSEPYISNLRSLIDGHEDVEFIISPSDNVLWDLYANCYAVLFPSFNEDWGIVPLEANAYGKPVIATNRGGLLESQVDGRTGFLVEPEADAFARAMKRLANEENLVRAMGRNARETAYHYDWSNFVDRIDTVIEELIEKRAVRRGECPS